MENNSNAIPVHVAIIPDGNRRWAKSKNLKPWEGHEAGAKNVEDLIEVALKKGVKCFSFWGSSVDNLTKRSLAEKKALLNIYRRYFKRLMKEKSIHEKEIKINVIGQWEKQFPSSLKNVIREVIEMTKNHRKRTLNFMLAYSGTEDILKAVEKINDKYTEKIKITAGILKNALMTSFLPPVDLLVRTGGEPHNSDGFLMWDTANSQLYFSDDFFPDFNGKKLEEAIEEYGRRQRRFGK